MAATVHFDAVAEAGLAPGLQVGMQVETSGPWEVFAWDGKWGPRSEIVAAGTRCLVTIADSTSAIIRICDSATYPELATPGSDAWCMPYGDFNHSGSAFLFTNGFQEQCANRECWNKFSIVADVVECRSRQTEVGDVVLCKVAHTTEAEQSGHQIRAGETAVVVELSPQGGFHLLDARGFVSEGWKHPKEYVFIGVQVSDSDLRSALKKSQISARAVAMRSLNAAQQQCVDARLAASANWFSWAAVAKAEEQLAQAQNIWHVQKLGNRPKCKYGGECFQQNPAHKGQFCHPSDYDWNVVDIPDRTHLCQIVATITVNELEVTATSLTGEVIVQMTSREPVLLGHIRKEIARSRGCSRMSVQIVTPDGQMLDGPDAEIFQSRCPTRRRISL